MNKNTYRILFILTDFIASGLGWSLFFVYRKLFIETVKFGVPVPVDASLNYLLGLVLIPIFWFTLHYSTGAYTDIRRKTHGQNFLQLFTITLLGSLVILFGILLDDTVISYKNYYQSFFVLLTLQFSICFIFRTAILIWKNNNFRKGKDHFSVLVVGDSNKIERFFGENKAWFNNSHFNICGYLQPDDTKGLISFITEQKPEEVFILTDKNSETYSNLLLTLYRKDVYIRVLPELYQTINIPVKLSDLLNSPILLLSKDLVSPWQQSIKTLSDIVLSFVAILLLLPLILILIILIKATSKGPIIYSHQRIGKNGKPFKILKFRSMYVDSEPEGPQLTSKNDRRITPVGRFMRKHRLDEIPNFINVFKGDMSLVGPRPERMFFIEQIIERAPQYAKLHLVKPGLTSWGQVKFGYAESIDEMIQRMRYDLVYIENFSLYVDLQILFKTIKIIIRGEGV